MIIHVHQNVSQKAIASERHSGAPNPIENLAIFIRVVQITQKGPFIGRKQLEAATDA